MDRLRRGHSPLQIESCASGGGRVDLGILARTDQVWTSDNTDALDRIRIQEGCSLAYPARHGSLGHPRTQPPHSG